jgi:hypothetical protein
MFSTEAVEKIQAHILCSVTFFFENHAVYKIMWKNTVQPDRPQNTVQPDKPQNTVQPDRPQNTVQPDSPQITVCFTRLHAGYLSLKTHDTDIRIIFIPSPLQQRLHERASMLRYTHISSLVGIPYYRKMAYFGRNML